MKSITIVYVHVPNDEPHVALAEQYVRSVQQFPGGYPHSNLILSQEGMPTPAMQALFSQLPNCSYYVHDDSGWDIGGFIAAAAQIKEDVMLCFGSSATVRKSGWLARMMEVWEKQGPGLYGSLASYQVRPHLNTTGFWCSPAMLLSYPKKVLTKEDRYEFEHGVGAFWRRISHAGQKVKLVTWCGEYDWKSWRLPRDISCRGTQENCLTYFRINYDYERCCQQKLPGRLNYEMLCDTLIAGSQGGPYEPAPASLPAARASDAPLEVFAFSFEGPERAIAQLRLTGPIGRLEQQKKMQLHWCTTGEPIDSIDGFLGADLVILQRDFCGTVAEQLIAAARALNKPVVFELDSLLLNVPKSYPQYQHSLAVTPGLRATLRDVDYITVPTEPLKRALESAVVEAKGKIHVIPNSIDPVVWGGAQPPDQKSSDPFALGVVCTAAHDEALQLIKPAVAQLMRKHAGRLVCKVWGFMPKGWETFPGVTLVRGPKLDFGSHAQDMLHSQLDLALAPISPHPFDQLKSDVKWLEFSICYIPGIYSAQPPYASSVEHGRTGWLVENTTAAWIDAVERLMGDYSLRLRLATQAHDHVCSFRHVDLAAERLHELYRSFRTQGAHAKSSASRNLDKACAHLLLHQAEVYGSRGNSEYASILRDQALYRYASAEPIGSFLQCALNQTRTSIRDLKITADLSAKLAAARAVADAGVKDRAIQLYMDTVMSLKQYNNRLLVIQTIADVCRALLVLDQPRGRELLKVGAELARSTRSAEGQIAIEKVEAEYRASSAGTEQVVPNVNAVTTNQGSAGNQGTVLSAAGRKRGVHERPEVSIVLPAYNNVALTRGCLESIARTPTTVPYEIVIVNNGSNDGTADLLREHAKFEHVRVLSFARNVGFAHASNQGARAARGEYLLFLNNDTVVTPGWLEALAQAIRRPQTGMVGAKLLYADGRIQHAGVGFINGFPDHPHRYAANDAPEVNQYRELDMVSGAVVLMRSQLFFDLAGFDEVYRQGAEDVDLCLRARAAGWKVAYEPKAVVYHLEGQSVGRFDHVTENLRIFFHRWDKWFDRDKKFVAPDSPTIIKASRSLFHTTAGVKPEPLSIDWIGSYLDSGSLSHVNRELSRSLSNFRDISLQRVGNGAPGSPAFESLRSQVAAHESANATITVRHQWPPEWRKPKLGALLVIQPWEFGTLPADWVRDAAAVDEFWAYTQYVRQAYIASGVNPAKVKVVPLGIDPLLFRPDAPAATLATTKTFKFLFVGGTIHRKGPDILLAAYLNAFSASDDVCLVIKDFGGKSVYAGQTLESQIVAAKARPNSPEILYLNEELAPETLPGLYTACDALVHPYRGEGFGLPILEAMACGLPVLVTAGGSADDFATDELAYKIPATKRLIGDSIGGLKLAGQGWLLEPDAVALCERMQWVVGHREAARDMGARASLKARTEWTWERAAAVAAAHLHALAERSALQKQLAEAASRHKPTIPSKPPVALHGDLTKAEELVRKKSPRAAWESVCESIAARPFHPAAFLLLAEICRVVGNAEYARISAGHALALAPAFKSAKKFLKGNLTGNTKPEWLVLPPALERRASKTKLTLSVCLIVKNEEQFIAQCLASVKGLADQIIVVDTGSTDATVAIAKEHGAEVYSFTWCDDFSAARNASLEHATGDWILVLDADEELPASSHAELRKHMSEAAVMAWRLPIVDAGREDAGQSYIPRLFRNAPGVYFAGRIHEHAFGSVEDLRKEWGLDNRLGTARLIHHGYTKELTQERGKVSRNLKLLELAVEESPRSPLLLMNLGLELCRSERIDAGITQYRSAFAALSAEPTNSVVPELREMLLTQFASYLLSTKGHQEVVQVLTSPLARQAKLTASLHYLLGMAYVELAQYANAAEEMRQCLATRNEATLTPSNPEIRKAAPRHCLALCHWRLKEIDAAAREFQQAIIEAPTSAALHLDFANFLKEQEKVGDALQLLHGFVSNHPEAAAVWLSGGRIALSQPELLEVAVDWTGVAVQQLPQNREIVAQRAEALMFAGQLNDALPLWQELAADTNLAWLGALVLCESAVGNNSFTPSRSVTDAISKEFMAWYWRLVEMRNEATLLQVLEHVDAVERVLPGAAQVLRSIIKELNTPASR